MSPETGAGAQPLPDPDRETFCQELIAGEELYRAYETAGFKRPRGNAQRMLQEPEVAHRLAWLQAKLAPLDEALIGYRRLEHRRALENIARANRMSLFCEKTISYTVGKKRRRVRTIGLRPLKELTDDQLALIDGIKISEKGAIEVLMPKRLDARAQLAKLDGLDAATRQELTGKDGGPISLEEMIVASLMPKTAG